MKQASSLLLLLLTASAFAFLLFLFRESLKTRLSTESDWATITLMFVLPPALFLLFSATMFGLLYPLGRLNNYVYGQVAGAASPFADDRLPSQILPPRDSEATN